MKMDNSYNCWLQYKEINDQELVLEYKSWFENIQTMSSSPILFSAEQELLNGISSILMNTPKTVSDLYLQTGGTVILGTVNDIEAAGFFDQDATKQLKDDGYIIQSSHKTGKKKIFLIGKKDVGVLYAAFHLLRLLQTGQSLENLNIIENPTNQLRMINQWDNIDGSIERGYAGKSIFFENNRITANFDRIKDYARLISSVGINAISINNVNVFEVETKFITAEFLPHVAKVANIFGSYGIKLFLSINYASPMQIGGLNTADPLDAQVQEWWKDRVTEIYQYIPDFGGFLVKADSEHRPGPFTYNRDHAEGANMLAEALEPFGGIVIWRAFVYNCLQDWRDRTTDRAKAAYDNFMPLDGKFLPNVMVQVKNGPMDFQVREPVSPLFGAMEKTNQVLEFQITQEYTGHQIDVCYLIPQWKEVLEYDTFAKGKGSTVKNVVEGSLYNYKHSGIAAVSNIGNDENWTGNVLAQANLYGYGRLIWNTDLASEEITDEWVKLTFGQDPQVVKNISDILLGSWRTYENYTAPLGVGWMVEPHLHYGPNIDGYEYSVWGTYHFADRDGIGVDRTVKTGTGYAGQYFSPNSDNYESIETCPDELLLFFHHVPYTHTLHSGETVIQHIYSTHFAGVEQVEEMRKKWLELEGKVDQISFANVRERFERQLRNAMEWRDRINTYFYRKSGIPDNQNRKIY